MPKHYKNQSLSVIMSVHNGEKFLESCIKSIIEQTYKNFDFIIVDDASSDDTHNILTKYTNIDSRITVLTNNQNLERSISRNIAINHSSADIIAVMDADDISFQNRLEEQMSYMADNPNIIVLGTGWINSANKVKYTMPQTDDLIRPSMLFFSPFCHPTVMMRRLPFLAVGGYRHEYIPTEDYDLWRRMAKLSFCNFANIKDILLIYRDKVGIDADSYHLRQKNIAHTIRTDYLIDILQAEGALDVKLALEIDRDIYNKYPKTADEIETWVSKIRQINALKKIYPEDTINTIRKTYTYDASVHFKHMPLYLRTYVPRPIKIFFKKIFYFLRKFFITNHI
jgi:glycosyltransferase involved in cell wall biosynthesis